MTSSRGSSLSILGGYHCSYPIIVSCKRGDDTHGGIGCSHTLREIITACLLVVSNREITKVTVNTHRGGAFYHGSVTGDAEAQSVLCEGERANLDSWLRDNLDSMLGQEYAEPFASRYWNLQLAILDLESVAGDELLSDSIRSPGRKPSPDRLVPGR